MKFAFLFPGQGVDVVHLVQDWMGQEFDSAGMLNRAESETGHSRREWLARGGSLLQNTEVLQPVLTAVNLLIDRELQHRGIRPALVAGHSLGELAAWASSGAVDCGATVTAAAARGRLMARQVQEHPGGMLALTEADKEDVEDILAGDRKVDLAAHNAPGEWVLTGAHPALKSVQARHGGTMLEVAGPWHARTMAPCIRPYRTILESMAAASPACGLVANRDGRLVADPQTIPGLLSGQMAHPIYWVTTMKTLATAGVSDYVILGPGRVLRGLVRRCLGSSTPVHLVRTPADLTRFLAQKQITQAIREGAHESK